MEESHWISNISPNFDLMMLVFFWKWQFFVSVGAISVFEQIDSFLFPFAPAELGSKLFPNISFSAKNKLQYAKNFYRKTHSKIWQLCFLASIAPCSTHCTILRVILLTYQMKISWRIFPFWVFLLKFSCGCFPHNFVSFVTFYSMSTNRIDKSLWKSFSINFCQRSFFSSTNYDNLSILTEWNGNNIINVWLLETHFRWLF